MDPISQLGWRNRGNGVVGPAAQLVRDVFAAADVVHSDAMSEMHGSGYEEAALHVQMEATVDSSTSRHTKCSTSLAASVEVDQEGQPHTQYLNLLFWLHHLCV